MDTKDKEPRHWLKMGIELEGGWNKDYRLVAQSVPGAKGKTDSSVTGLPTHYMGEITTHPHNNIEQLVADCGALWPDIVNNTCGFHIHTSFSPIDTGRLADERFWEFFLQRWEEWGRKVKAPGVFWERLNGQGQGARRYKRVFDPWGQLATHNHDLRYTQVNWVSYYTYQTIECRVLPMFPDREMAFASIYELANIYETWLGNNKFPTIKLDKALQEAGNVVIELHERAMPDISYLEETKAVPTKPLPKDFTDTGVHYEYDLDNGEIFIPTRGNPKTEPSL